MKARNKDCVRTDRRVEQVTFYLLYYRFYSQLLLSGDAVQEKISSLGATTLCLDMTQAVIYTSFTLNLLSF